MKTCYGCSMLLYFLCANRVWLLNHSADTTMDGSERHEETEKYQYHAATVDDINPALHIIRSIPIRAIV